MEEKHRMFITLFDELSQDIHQIATDKGWWEKPRNKGEAISLMHSELSEALESIRHGDPPSDKIPDFKGSEEEFADTIIRILDFAQGFGLNISEALIAKMFYNMGRPYKHGGKKF